MITTDLHTPSALKIYSHGLQRLFNANWTGLDLYYLSKGPIRGGLMDTTKKEGILHHLGKWFYQEYILEEGYWNSGSVLSIVGEKRLFYLNSLIDLLVHHGVEENIDLLGKYRTRVKEIIDLRESDEKKYLDFIRSIGGSTEIRGTTNHLRITFEDFLREIEHDYAKDYAERAFHDRELCAYISRLLISIGCAPIDTETGEPKQWVKRAHIPNWARRAVVARERGSCAECGKNITDELSKAPHIDHIIPLSKGGTNDLVNLQLLCSECNQSKGTKNEGVNRSMPPYFGSKDESANRSMTPHSQ